MNYQSINEDTINRWVEEGWEWSRPISHEDYLAVRPNDFRLLLTPTKPIPCVWLGDLTGKKVLGLASGGGQQGPLLKALGADVTILDNSSAMLEVERQVMEREGYQLEIVKADMTQTLPFEDETFDYIIHPVSNCYVEKVEPIWRECARVLKSGGYLLAGVNNEVNYIVDGTEKEVIYRQPFNPIVNTDQRDYLLGEDSGYQFSHTIDEQVGGQLRAGLQLLDIYGDTNGEGHLHELNIETFYVTRSVKP